MGFIPPDNPINIASFSFGAILVCLTCLVYMALRGRFEKSQSKVFLALVVILLVNAVCSMVAEVFKGQVMASDAARIAVVVANYMYFVGHTMLAPMVCVYFLTVCGRPATRKSTVYVSTHWLKFSVSDVSLFTRCLVSHLLCVRQRMGNMAAPALWSLIAHSSHH